MEHRDPGHAFGAKNNYQIYKNVRIDTFRNGAFRAPFLVHRLCYYILGRRGEEPSEEQADDR